ncbi:polysaccharide pyruvyl transferase family protein [Lysinibacillus telephonicus]|uniref:Polysaccharide pyruvyl transferase family protein n=1 Tax=Lysinibacillus telephonicus TaxID=1714840 RepID=A0A431UQK0_9BACI|nr:polysaccharide pyruvyl transferase family protein [Lysinibacillus telephonicus]RTQ92092.1 polysaccharide pyruvyl transferase family protein [Lysinibacillus telephonicus]
MKKVLYIGWIGYKNLGDELMADIFKQQFSILGESYKLDFVNIEHKYLKNVSPNQYDLIVLGGGSILSGNGNLIHPYIIEYLYNCLTINKKIMIWGSGIDWAPKDYIERLENNVEIPILISNNFSAKIKQVFMESVWSGVRGPLTLKVLEQYGVRKDAHISGDPGFLLKPQVISKNEQINKLQSTLQHNEKIIGVNWGTSFNNIYGEDEITVEDQLAVSLNQFIENGYFIYLFSVWRQDFPSIERLYSKLDNKSQVILDRNLYNEYELMDILQNCTFTINFKLHANFISLAANVPFIAFGYRFKVFDFVKSINHEKYLVSTDEQNISEQISQLESDIINNRSTILSNLNVHQTNFRKKIIEPFNNGLYI